MINKFKTFGVYSKTSILPDNENQWSIFSPETSMTEIVNSTEAWFRAEVTPNLINLLLQYRNEDIGRLENEIASLKNEIAQVKKQSGRVSVQIKNLYNDKLELKEPLNIILEQDSGSFVASSVDIDAYGIGDSEKEAIKDLGDNIEDLYFTLKKEGKEKLGPDMLKISNFISSIIRSTKNATKSSRGKASV